MGFCAVVVNQLAESFDIGPRLLGLGKTECDDLMSSIQITLYFLVLIAVNYWDNIVSVILEYFQVLIVVVLAVSIKVAVVIEDVFERVSECFEVCSIAFKRNAFASLQVLGEVQRESAGVQNNAVDIVGIFKQEIWNARIAKAIRYEDIQFRIWEHGDVSHQSLSCKR